MMHNFLRSDKHVLEDLKFLRHLVQCHSGLPPANYCKLSDIFSIIKSRRVEWMGYVASIKKKKNIFGIPFRKPEGKRNLEKLMDS
jgi:hypothetical protein